MDNSSEKDFNNNSEVYKKEETLKEMFIGMTGRLNRFKFFYRSILVYILQTALLLTLFDKDTPGAMLAIFFVLIWGAISYYSLMTRRLHDIDKDDTLAKGFMGIYAVSMVLVLVFDITAAMYSIFWVVQLGVWMYLIFAKGTVGANKYGSDPLEGTLK